MGEESITHWTHLSIVTLLKEAVAQSKAVPLDAIFVADAILAALSPAPVSYQRALGGYSINRISAGMWGGSVWMGFGRSDDATSAGMQLPVRSPSARVVGGGVALAGDLELRGRPGVGATVRLGHD